MKKKFSVVFLVALMIASLFVSCDDGMKSSDPRAMVHFVDSDSLERGLNSSSPEFDATKLYWTYEAQKMDNSGLKTGETTEAVAVSKNSEAGLSESVGPFSLGVWKFTLHAHETSVNGAEVYTGTVSNVVIKAGKSNNVNVKVHAIQEGKGKIEILDITLTDASGNPVSDYNEIITLTPVSGSTPVEETNPSSKIFTVDTGAWKVNVKYVSKTDSSIVYGNNSIYVTVFANQTVTVSGSLEEITGSADFETTADGGFKAEKTQALEFVEAQGDTDFTGQNIVKIEAGTSPVITEKPSPDAQVEKKTTVTIPQNAVSNVSGNAKLNVTSYAAPVAGKKFTVEGTSEGQATNVVSALDIDLSIADQPVSTFAEPIRVVTYIPTGLSNVSVIYNGGGEQPTDIKYNAETGELSFKTTHFSVYCIVADSEAMNTRSSKSFDTLKSALADPDVKPGDEIMLLKDIVNTVYDSKKTISFHMPSGVILNGNGHSITGNCDVYINAKGGTVKNLEFKYIHNNATSTAWDFPSGKNGTLSALYAKGLTGKAVIENCVFNTFDWEGIQITPVAGAEVVITGNTFRYDDNNGLGMNYPLRNIHVQSTKNVDFSIVATGNVLLDNNKLFQTGFEIYYPADMSKVFISGNYIDSPVGVCLFAKNGEDIATSVLPFSKGPNGEPAYHAVCYTYDSYDNVLFYESLDAAVAKLLDGKKIVLVEDIVIDGALPIPENRINMNGHTISQRWDGTATPKEQLKPVKGNVGSSIDIDNAFDFAGIMATNSGFTADLYPMTINITKSIDLDGGNWVPANVSVREIIINGNGHSITNMNVNVEGNAGLIGKVGGGGKVTINDLILDKATIIGDEDDSVGTNAVGGFVAEADGAEKISINNCSLINSTVKGGHWIGGIVGTASGYHVSSNGPVFLDVNVTGCTVSNTLISGKGSAGGVTGHAARNPWTKFTIAELTLSDVDVTSLGSKNNKAGSILGTVGDAGKTVNDRTGGVYVNNIKSITNVNVKSNQTVIDRIYGRVGSSNGILYLDGKPIASANDGDAWNVV